MTWLPLSISTITLQRQPEVVFQGCQLMSQLARLLSMCVALVIRDAETCVPCTGRC